jgi:phosphatidylglycerophosphatase A
MADSPAPRDLARQVLRDPVHWLAFGLGSGLLPVAPGTWGSLLAVGIFWALPPVPLGVMLPALGAAFVAGCVICGTSARRLGVHDHGGIVFDEIVAMLLVLCVTPRTPGWTLAAFLAFRAFDVAKPWPIREADHRLTGGLGIMLDDVLAAVYAALVVRGALLLPLF